MYLRTIRRRNADGSVVEYYQLAENIWDREKRCAVAKVVYSFGRGDNVDPEAMRRLARSILRVFSSEEALAAEPGVHVIQSWPYGGAYVLDALWAELEIPKAIAASHPKKLRQPVERALFAMVANKALRPYSKLYCHEQWLSEEVFFPGRESLQLQHLYRAMDFLEAHKEEIERAIYFRMADLLDADVDLIFYDTTSMHFEIEAEDEQVSYGNVTAGRGRYGPLRKRGYSKNGRGDAPQIVVGLAVTRDGLPVRSWVFPGNTNDVTTIDKVKSDLRGWRLNRCVFVGDAGMNSEDNRRRLSLGGGKYILATKMRAGDEVTNQVLTRAGRYQKVADNLRVKEVVVGDGERRRRYVVCHNPEQADRQRQHRDRLLEELRLELKSQREPIRKGRHAKRTCELVTSRRYGRYLRQTPKGIPKIDQAAVAAEAKLDGKWVITSNDDTLSAEDLALGYKQLMRVEECWRTMKSGLRTRPIFHWTPHRICAHISLCVLALLLERVAERRVGDTWRNIVATLDSIKVIEYERGGAHVLQTTALRSDTAELLRTLKLAPPPKVHHVTQATSPGAGREAHA
jgi:transposase